MADIIMTVTGYDLQRITSGEQKYVLTKTKPKQRGPYIVRVVSPTSDELDFLQAEESRKFLIALFGHPIPDLTNSQIIGLAEKAKQVGLTGLNTPMLANHFARIKWEPMFYIRCRFRSDQIEDFSDWNIDKIAEVSGIRANEVQQYLGSNKSKKLYGWKIVKIWSIPDNQRPHLEQYGLEMPPITWEYVKEVIQIE